MVAIAPEALTQWAIQALMTAQVPEKDAQAVAEALVQTSLWGIDSHGVARLPHYLNRLSRSSLKAQPEMTFTQTAAATGQVNGDHGLGIVVCRFAMENAIALAQTAGVGIVGVSHSSHCGAIGLYTRQACAAGMMGIAFTHSDALVVPHLGQTAFFGTNPISIAMPSQQPDEPLCLDMATSVVPWNRILNARNNQTPVPLGWGVDAQGADTTDLDAMVALKPMAEHKGYALGFLIDMLCGPLNGMAFGPQISQMYGDLDQYRELGSLVIAIDPQRFAGGAFLSEMVSKAIYQVKTQNPEALFPGEPEYISEAERQQTGIPMPPALVQEFQDWSEKLAIAPPTYNSEPSLK
jgi:ureidoglycolate dehydrogenase (NAD+)